MRHSHSQTACMMLTCARGTRARMLVSPVSICREMDETNLRRKLMQAADAKAASSELRVSPGWEQGLPPMG